MIALGLGSGLGGGRQGAGGMGQLDFDFASAFSSKFFSFFFRFFFFGCARAHAQVGRIEGHARQPRPNFCGHQWHHKAQSRAQMMIILLPRQARDERETTTMSYDNVADAAGDKAGEGGKRGLWGN